MQNTKNIMIVGVGGQGTLLASRILGNAVISEGYDVKVSEVHGMRQRGGSVVTYVKYGDKVFSPLIDRGEADMILAFEKLEAARALPYLKEGGTVILNDREIAPMPVITGAAEYPDGLVADIAAKAWSAPPGGARGAAASACPGRARSPTASSASCSSACSPAAAIFQRKFGYRP